MESIIIIVVYLYNIKLALNRLAEFSLDLKVQQRSHYKLSKATKIAQKKVFIMKKQR